LMVKVQRLFAKTNLKIPVCRKENGEMYQPQKVRPKNLTIGGRYFYV